MQDFYLWFSTGFAHITDWQGYDHILFVCVLCVAYSITEWKKLLLLITSFTIGHSLTLALSVLNIICLLAPLIEFLIPLTIVITALSNIANRNKEKRNMKLLYGLALCFGFIHGMGFSYLLRSLLGKEENILPPLFAFNIGLELGQLFILAVFLLISVFLQRFFQVKTKDWNFFISSAVFGVAFIMMTERIKPLIELCV